MQFILKMNMILLFLLAFNQVLAAERSAINMATPEFIDQLRGETRALMERMEQIRIDLQNFNDKVENPGGYLSKEIDELRTVFTELIKYSEPTSEFMDTIERTIEVNQLYIDREKRLQNYDDVSYIEAYETQIQRFRDMKTAIREKRTETEGALADLRQYERRLSRARQLEDFKTLADNLEGALDEWSKTINSTKDIFEVMNRPSIPTN